MSAITRWPQQSYLNKFAHHPIEIEVGSHYSTGYGERHETSLGSYLTLLSQPLPYHIYMAQYPLFERIPELQSDVLTPLVQDILQEGENYSTATWIGKQILTPLHRDPQALTNLFIQICGRKWFRMFSPEVERDKLQLGKGIMRNTANIDVWEEDIGEGLEGIVSPGDGIIIPRGWWHSVRSQEDELNISVNWWFKINTMTPE